MSVAPELVYQLRRPQFQSMEVTMSIFNNERLYLDMQGYLQTKWQKQKPFFQQPPLAGSIELRRPLPLSAVQCSSASGCEQTITTAIPFTCASCMILTALSTVIPGITFIKTWTTYSRLFSLSLCRTTRNGGDIFRDFLQAKRMLEYPGVLRL